MLTLHLDRPAHRFTYDVMNCVFTFHLLADDPRYAKQAATEARQLLERLEDLLSLYRDHSDVCRINAAQAGESLRISEEAASCLAIAMRASAMTGNAFHPFCGAAALRAKGQASPLDVTSRIGNDEPVLELDPANCIVLKHQTGLLLDLGGIGKGFALDAVATLLQDEWGIPEGLLIAGGSSVLAFGANDSAPWPLQLENCAPIPGLKQAALGCSGFGFQPNHIIDPRTAEPIDNERHTCVHAQSAALADALATAAIVMPQNQLDTLFEPCGEISLMIDDGQCHHFGPFFSASGI